MKNNQSIRKDFQGKPNSDIVNFPLSLRRDFLSPVKDKSLLKMPISSPRILFKILNDLSNEQFQPKRQLGQLSLFDKEFRTVNNTFARFTFDIKDIDINNNENYNNIRKGLEFLENYKKGWYKSTNEKGKVIKSYGGLISNSNISEGKISFLVSSYWLEKLMLIPKYNVALFQTPWLLSKSKQVLFYLWLLEVPDNGTKVLFGKLQETYQYNYKTPKDYCKYVLKPIKDKLDKYSNKSFNYKIKLNYIIIVPYYTKEVQLKLKEKTITSQEITQKLHYWKVRHHLTTNDISVLKSLINIEPNVFKLLKKSYSLIIEEYRIKKIKVTNLKGNVFINFFQKAIIKEYKNTIWANISPNGYPNITGE